MPTRQDSQGVSMCEVISSGLVPVVSNNTAIPEFVNSSFCYSCNSIQEYGDAIEEMYYNPEIYIDKSRNTINLNETLNEQKIIEVLSYNHQCSH